MRRGRALLGGPWWHSLQYGGGVSPEYGQMASSYERTAQHSMHPRRGASMDTALNKESNLGKHGEFPFARAARARTRTKVDPAYETTRSNAGQPPYPHDIGHGGSTARRTGSLTNFPQIAPMYPNPKKHRPILATPRPHLGATSMGVTRPITRKKLPLELRPKLVMQNSAFTRPHPGLRRARYEMYVRLKHGLYDLDRIMPPLWGPQEESKLDQDEWMLKILYFLHPIEEDALLSRAETFCHCPFENRKEMVLALERLVSREYVRRVKGSMLRHPNVELDEHYWTLMPDEVAFCERIVLEEQYLWAIKDGRMIDEQVDKRYPVQAEMCTVEYHEKHNTMQYLMEERSISKLEAFLEFCEDELKQCKEKLASINKDVDFDEDDEEETAGEDEYQDPPTMIANPVAKKPWHSHGHWANSVPDKRLAGPPPA